MWRVFLAMSLLGVAHAEGMVRKCLAPPPDPKWEAWFQNKLEGYRLMARTGFRTNIPVIVHVIHRGQPVGEGENLSQAQVLSQIDILNEDFSGQGFYADPPLTEMPSVFAALRADSRIKFCAATQDANGNVLPEPGIHRVGESNYAVNAASLTSVDAFWDYMLNTVQPATIWDMQKYLNIWTTDQQVGLLGYATSAAGFGTGIAGLPEGDMSTAYDGVWVGYRYFGRNSDDPTYNLGRTASHEVGHWLGLYHTWGDGECATDYCNDTPVERTANGYCAGQFPYFLGEPCPGADPDVGEMYQNFMDYAADACVAVFTNDQELRMNAVLSIVRTGLDAHAKIVCKLCGDKFLDQDEACDDGNDMANDGCSTSCAIEPHFMCNGEPSQCACVSGYYYNGSACALWKTCSSQEYETAAPTSTSDRVCTALTNCSAGQYVSSLPTSVADRVCAPCAAGTYSNANNQTACTACPAGTSSSAGATTCVTNTGGGGGGTVVTPVCGDGILAAGEACDDGNDSNGDGCSTACVVEPELDYSKLDSDGDTLSDELEGRNPIAPLSSVIKAFSTLGVDHDDDGTPDFLDTDSDNDGISDKEEVVCTATNELSLCIATADTDGDGTPDYADVSPGTALPDSGGAPSGGSSGCSATGSEPQNMPLAEILILGLVGLMLRPWSKGPKRAISLG